MVIPAINQAKKLGRPRKKDLFSQMITAPPTTQALVMKSTLVRMESIRSSDGAARSAAAQGQNCRKEFSRKGLTTM
jgi:hypothetical protein